jgi:hypothetical protein
MSNYHKDQKIPQPKPANPADKKPAKKQAEDKRKVAKEELANHFTEGK